MLRCETWILFCLMISGIIHVHSACSEHALQQTLFENYNKKVRPVRDQSTITVLQVYTKIYNIISINEQDESIELVVWMALMWNDEFLRWNPPDFDNCSFTYALASEVWQPDYIIANILDSVSLIPSDVLYVYIESNGEVLMWQGYRLTLKCAMNIATFPFDTQTCTIKGTLWMFDATQIYLKLADEKSATTDIKTGSTEFETVSFEGKESPYFEPLTNETYSELDYFLKLRRLPEYYIFVLIVPSFLLTSLCIIGIFMPNSSTGDRNEKMTLGLTTLLSMAVILNITADAMPKSSNGLPLLGYYVLYEIGMCSLAIILSTAIIFIHERATTQDWEPPTIILWIANLKTPCQYLKKAMASTELEKECSPSHQQILSKLNQQNQIKTADSRTIASVDCITNDHEMTFYIRHILSKINRHLDMLKQDSENKKVWIIALDRIDLALLVLFLISNCIFTAVILS